MLTGHRFSRGAALILRRAPILADVVRVLMNWTQARFTAGVVAVVHNDNGEILLVEHVFHPRCPWGLPGGWLARGEAPADGVQRELKEELELQVQIIDVLLVDTGYLTRSHLDMAYLCRSVGDVGRLSAELLDYRWVSLDSLPSLLPFHLAAVNLAEPRIRPAGL